MPFRATANLLLVGCVLLQAAGCTTRGMLTTETEASDTPADRLSRLPPGTYVELILRDDALGRYTSGNIQGYLSWTQADTVAVTSKGKTTEVRFADIKHW